MVLTALKSMALLGCLGPELELIPDTIDVPNMLKCSPIKEIPVQASIGMALAGHPRFQETTKLLHRK